MEKIKVEEILNAVNGRVLNGDITEKYISSVTTDSRQHTEKGLFIAIKGEKTDGHKYIDNAAKNGAVVALISEIPEEFVENVIYIKVKDTTKALQDLACMYRLKFNIPVIAVTGSVGKTTTKDMIACVLKTKYSVLKTEGNFNSEIGAPITLLKLNNNHEIAVIEMGMDHLGQIAKISEIAKPDTAVITNIGVAHIEYLKTRENILKAKCEVFNNLSKDGVAILNADDDMLIKVDNKFKKIWYGTGNDVDIKVQNVKVDYTDGLVRSDIYINSNKYELVVPGLSYHLIYSAMAAVAVGLRYNIDIYDILRGISNYTHTKMRMDIYKLKNNILLIDDTYNANPDSMKSLINTVKDAKKTNKVLILGDMFELGENSIALHEEVLQYALDNDITKMFVVGENMNKANSLLKNSRVTYYETKEILLDNLDKIILSDSIIAIKASRGMRFENITKKILEKEISL